MAADVPGDADGGSAGNGTAHIAGEDKTEEFQQELDRLLRESRGGPRR